MRFISTIQWKTAGSLKTNYSFERALEEPSEESK
jgi:hypothetical protein